MKSLDEVINALSICHQTDTHRLCKGCPYPDDSGCLNALLTDAFDWLRIYQDEIIQYRKDLRNDPLTWDELRTMEGKPVWVEELGRKYATPHWAIHNGIMDGYDGDENLYLQPFEVLTKYTLGKTWQAYRKERTDGLHT